MRTFVVLLIGLVAIPLVAIPSAAGAPAGSPATLSLQVSSHKVLFAHGVTVSGKLSGGLVAGRAVLINAWPYGKSAPQAVATVETNVNGQWSFRVKPGIQTIYQARVGHVLSPEVTIGVEPTLTVTELLNGRIRAEVRAARPFTRRIVQLQTRNADGTWTTTDRARLSTASIAVFPAALPTTTVRIAMSVNQAGAGFLGTMSHPMVYRTESLTMAGSASKVLFGHPVMLSGRLMNGHAGEHVSIIARPYGLKVVKLATVRINSTGRFTLAVTPTVQTTYQAHFAGVQTSGGVTVGVRPPLTVHELTNGRLVAHVKANASFTGRMVELQRLNGGAWQTLAKQPLHSDSTATFTLLVLPNSTIRVAMSVNQAGAGYLGTYSHPLLYRAV